MSLRKGSKKYRVLRHLLNEGALTHVDAVLLGISVNIKSRIPEIRQMGFEIEAKKAEGKKYKKYFIAPEKLEDYREKFKRMYYENNL